MITPLNYIYCPLSNWAHLQLQPVTGQSLCSLNQSIKWLAWPPCLHVWHQVNQELNWLSLASLLPGLTSGLWTVVPLAVPIFTRQTAHLGRGFLQLGQDWILALFPPPRPFKKACSDQKSKPAFLSDKSLEASVKYIVRKFPNIDPKQLSNVQPLRNEVLKSLSLYYYTFVDLLDFKVSYH